MNGLLFVLGRDKGLCLLELKSYFRRKGINCRFLKLADNVYWTNGVDKAISSELINELGGLVKIACVLGRGDLARVKEFLLADLIDSPKKRLLFGISSFSLGLRQNKEICKHVKRLLGKYGKTGRFILPKVRQLSGPQTQKDLKEYLLIETRDNALILGRVIERQDYRFWIERDVNKPYKDLKRGILPSKIARMMVNIARVNHVSGSDDFLLYDPFCGGGTILVEAAYLGLSVVGSDISKKAITGACKNLWTLCKIKAELHVADATQAGNLFGDRRVDAIVSEFYLGPLIRQQTGQLYWGGYRLDSRRFNVQVDLLERLYIAVFANCSTFIVKGGMLVVVLPYLKLGGLIKTRWSAVDTCEKFGYTLRDGPFIIVHPHALIGRAVYVLSKK